MIGSHLVATLLAGGAEVVGLDNFSAGRRDRLRNAVADAQGRFTIIEGDICDRHACRDGAQGVRYVAHLAAIASVAKSIADPEATHTVNVEGFRNVLEAARSAGAETAASAT